MAHFHRKLSCSSSCSVMKCARNISPLRVLISATLIIVALHSTVASQPLSTLPISPTPDDTFRIGFLKADVEPLLNESLFQRYGAFLEHNPELMHELKKAGKEKIAVLPTDGFRDMVQRMNHNEFDLVYCSPTVYVQQQGDYEVILQTRRPRDIFDASGRGKVLQRGALIVSQEQWEKLENPAGRNSISRFLQNARIAVVSTYSATGYIFPIQKIKKEYGISVFESLIFCDSSEEVVKYVITGLADAGCCERGAVDDVIKDAGIESDISSFVHIVFETDPIPTNPLVIRKKYHPRDSVLGREIMKSTRQFFNQLPPSLPRFESSRDEYFSNLREQLSLFDLIKEYPSGKSSIGR